MRFRRGFWRLACRSDRSTASAHRRPPRSLKSRAVEINISASGVAEGPFGSTEANGHVQLVFRLLRQPTHCRDSAQIPLFATDLTTRTNASVDTARAFDDYFPISGALLTDSVRWTLAIAP